jgi:hypothetical protein
MNSEKIHEFYSDKNKNKLTQNGNKRLSIINYNSANFNILSLRIFRIF